MSIAGNADVGKFLRARSFSDENSYAVEENAVDAFTSKEEKASLSAFVKATHSKCWAATTQRIWPALIVFLGLITMMVICNRPAIKRVERGSVRRLAGGDDDELLSPPSPVLEELCSALGPWVPPDSSSAGLRRSPLLVADVLTDIESDGGSNDAGPSGFAAGPPVRFVNSARKYFVYT